MTFLLAAQISASSTNGLSLSLGLFAYKSRAVNEHSLSSPLLSETHDGSQQRSLFTTPARSLLIVYRNIARSFAYHVMLTAMISVVRTT